MSKAYRIKDVIIEPVLVPEPESKGKVKKFYIDGYTYYTIKGKVHRNADLPAIVSEDGYKAWYKNGMLHRIGKPAIIYPSGTEEYFKNGKRHNDFGPAIISRKPFENIFYYLNGEHVSKRLHTLLTLKVRRFKNNFVTLERNLQQ